MIREGILFTAMTMMFLLIGYVVGYLIGDTVTMMSLALMIAVAMNGISYLFGDKLVMAMTGARLVSEQEAPQLHALVERVAMQAKIPKPKVGIVRTLSPNAFATGRSPRNSIVCVTEGSLRLLNEQELEGVIGHEISHIIHRDTLIAAIAATLAGALSWLAYIGRMGLIFGGGRRDQRGGGGGELLALFGLIFVPIAATLMQLAISRGREYDADEGSARLTRRPLSLASALEKIERAVRSGYTIRANPSTSPLWIANPFAGDSLAELFMTHPSTRKRIERLQMLAREI
ncbi:MAG: M48 family metalloprotease, partial [Thermoproteota archaeon]